MPLRILLMWFHAVIRAAQAGGEQLATPFDTEDTQDPESSSFPPKSSHFTVYFHPL